MTPEIFEAIKSELGVSRKIARRYNTMRGAPLDSAAAFIQWHREVKMASDRSRSREWRQVNREKLKRQMHESYLRNKEKVIARCNARRQRPEVRAYNVQKNKEWRAKNPEKRRAYAQQRKESGRAAEYERQWRKANPEKSREKVRRWCARNPEKVSAYGKAYRQANREKVNEWRRNAHHRGMKDPVFVIIKRMRGRLYDELRFRGRKTTKLCSVVNLFGCTRHELAFWIQSQFKKGMNWGNRSKWHVDHIRPIASFDMNDLEQQKLCFHYTNLRPLWKGENARKHDAIIPFPATNLEMFPEMKQDNA